MFSADTTLHPLRWALVLLVAVPVLLVAAEIAASATHHGSAGAEVRTLLRVTLVIELLLILLLAITGVVYERIHRARNLRLYPPPGRLIDVGGYRLHLYCTGEGSPTVVLEHGLDGSYLDWRRVQPEVARFTRVCSFDRAGYGYSDRSPNPRLPEAMVEELHTVLERAGEKPPFLVVGHSMAAFDAIMFASRFPEEVSAIVLVDGAHPDERLPFRWKERVWLRFLQFTSPFGLPRWRKWCAGSDKELQNLKAAVNCKPRVFATHYQQRATFDNAAAQIRGLSKPLQVPAVIISRDPDRSSADPRTEQRWAQLQTSLLQFSGNSKQIIVSGSGHGIPGQRPDVIINAIDRLVKEMRGHGRQPVTTTQTDQSLR